MFSQLERAQSYSVRKHCDFPSVSNRYPTIGAWGFRRVNRLFGLFLFVFRRVSVCSRFLPASSAILYSISIYYYFGNQIVIICKHFAGEMLELCRFLILYFINAAVKSNKPACLLFAFSELRYIACGMNFHVIFLHCFVEIFIFI